MNTAVSVIAGDERMLALAETLCDMSYDVAVIGLEKCNKCSSIRCENSIYETVSDSKAVILPVPLTKDGRHIFAPFSDREILISDVMQCIDGKTVVFTPVINQELKKYKHKFVNFTEDETFIIENARLTAEGTLVKAIEITKSSMLAKKVLVIGNGRVGKAVSSLFDAVGADVSVSARKTKDFAKIKCAGMKPLHTEKISKYIRNFEIIINTVPSMVLGKNQLNKANEKAVIIDLATGGGTDFEYAGKIGVNAKLLPGIPGKILPVSSGKILADTVVRLLGDDKKCMN